MYRFMTKYGTMVAFGLGLLISLIGILIVMGGLEEFNMLPEEEQSTTDIFNFSIAGALALVVLCAVAMLLFGVYNVIVHPKGAIKFIAGLAVIIVLVVVFYSVTEAETSGKVYHAIQQGELTANTSKWINGAIATTLILLGGAALAFILSEIRNLFK